MTNQPQCPSPCPSNPAEILDALLCQHEPALRAQATRHAPDPDAAEDAFQDGCVEFLRYYKGPHGVDALRYLLIAIKQRAWAIRREQRRQSLFGIGCADASEDAEALAIPDERPGPVALVERHERHAERCEALARLKPDQRTALILLAAGFSYREIADRRGWTYTKVNRSIAEGRAALREAAVG